MADWGTSLAADFADIADDVRSVATDLGARTHRVFLVRRRSGDDGLVRETELTPTPRVMTEGSRYGFAPMGIVREGEVYVSEISLRYDSDVLRGQDACEPGAHFAWELRPMVSGPTLRCSVQGDPVRDHERAEYRVNLTIQAQPGEEVVHGGGYA